MKSGHLLAGLLSSFPFPLRRHTTMTTAPWSFWAAAVGWMGLVARRAKSAGRDALKMERMDEKGKEEGQQLTSLFSPIHSPLKKMSAANLKETARGCPTDRRRSDDSFTQ
jgi:hypothetical protein